MSPGATRGQRQRNSFRSGVRCSCEPTKLIISTKEVRVLTTDVIGQLPQ